jgi:hypothetical protein
MDLRAALPGLLRSALRLLDDADAGRASPKMLNDTDLTGAGMP